VVEKIFEPLIEDIGRMVDDQVNLVQKKRLAEGLGKGTDIKVMLMRLLAFLSDTHKKSPRQSFLWEASVPASI
jgi:hypothetical protein